jgi:hypothetical protein
LLKRSLAALFAVLLAVWSWLLVKPSPVPESLLGGVGSVFDPVMLQFILAKLTHLSVYAFFAVLGGLIPATRRGQLGVWGGLVLHGVLSEVGQMVGSAHFDTGRHGCVRDVLIDAAGIIAGAALLRWRQNRRPVANV